MTCAYLRLGSWSFGVGQGVGLMNASLSVRTVVFDFMQDFAEAAERLGGLLEG